ncbi:MAG TPA: hypothetical protein VK524_12520 [Polyangiaceae bacterium]|nr:hypothetical protein [Polyangiaceae bacterium]
MSSASRPPSLNSQASPIDPGLLTQTIARLRGEYEQQQASSGRALLLHEIGVLEEALGDEASAARDQLGAVNTEPEFREPLERLIAIIERRQSFKNLGKLLERLVRVSDTPEERARALALRAAYLADHESDVPQAREALERALAERPDDCALWLMLEVLAGRAGDDALRARALAARARLTQHPTWRALLWIDHAESQAEAGNADGAIEALDHAVEQTSSASFIALLALEELGQRQQRDDWVARALEAQAKLILQAIEDAQSGNAHGVPHYRRTAAYAADTFMRAADAQRRRGDWAAATGLLDQALARLPDEPALLHARLSAAESSGDTATAARLAEAEIARGATGPLAAALHLRVAEAAAEKADGSAALAAVQRALHADSACIPARALELDLLSSGHDPQGLAGALEQAAEGLETDEAKARFYLLSADVWARLCGDTQGAKAALSQAGMFGAAPGTVARVARMLAGLMRDGSWYEEATRRLLAAGAAEAEESGLWFELVRARLLRGEAGSAEQALQALCDARAGSWLGHALRAYARPFAKPPVHGSSPPRASLPPLPPTSALKLLAQAENNAEWSRALRTVVSVRALLDGQIDTALEELSDLHAAEPGDTLVSAALAALLRSRNEGEKAASVLFACAGAAENDDALAAALEIEAGILYWQAGAKSASVETFKSAALRSSKAADDILGWALRAHEPNGLEARRQALDSAAEGHDAPNLALERFALEVGREGDGARAAEALRTACEARGEIGTAGHLARALWSHPQSDDLQARLAALDELSQHSPEASAMARAAAYQLRLAQASGGDPDAHELEASALAWAEADGSAAAALEWLAHASHAGNVVAEVRARRALAERLDGEARAPLEASAALVALLGGEHPPGLIQDASSLYARFTNLELAPPGSDPRRRSQALLSAPVEIEHDNPALLRALAGWNQLAELDVAGALASFRAVCEEYPEETIGWEGLRAAAEQAKDYRTLAEACAALGDAVSDPARGAELWEEAANVLLEKLADEERGEFALTRAVTRDIQRFSSFDRLFRRVRSRRDGARLLELISQRLEVADDSEEIAKMFWERARVLRESGDRQGALSALENVTFLEPDHVGALALSGEIYIKNGQFAEAAENLGRLAALSDAPTKQRLMSGVAAVDLYENKLHDIDKAFEVLLGLYRSGLSTLPVRERLARVAAKASAWHEATQALEHLMQERESREGRMEAARLALAIYRDRLDDASGAALASEKLLAESPEDGEALDLVLTGAVSLPVATRMLTRGRDALVSNLLNNPIDAERVDRLARIAAHLEDAPLRQAALGVLLALGEGSHEMDHELSILDRRVAHIPQIAIDERAVPELCDDEERGPLGELMRELAATFALALGPSLAALGVGKKDRVDPRAGLPLRNEVAAWAGALGIGDFELYIGGREAHGVYAIATEMPAIVLGPVISAPLSAAHRQAVARELFALKRGTTILRHRDLNDISALLVAACRLAGLNPPSPEYAMLGEFQRLLGKEMSRRVRRVLPELAARALAARQDPGTWARAAIASLDRMASIAAGDVSWVLCGGNPETRGQLGASREAETRARRVFRFVLSPTYLTLREKLGMGVR